MSDLTTLIVDLLRKKEEEKALMNGGPTAGVQAQATPGMLGSGAAQKAAEMILRQKMAPMQAADAAS